MQNTQHDLTTPVAAPPLSAGADVAAITGILGDPIGEQATEPLRRRFRIPWKTLLSLAVVAGGAAASPWVLAHIGKGSGANPLANIPSHTVERGELLIRATKTSTSSAVWRGGPRLCG